MRLRDLKTGDQAVVVGYAEGDNSYRSKLLAMGFTRGSVVKIVKVAPLGDPVKVEIRGYDLSLRKDEADALVVESRP